MSLYFSRKGNNMTNGSDGRKEDIEVRVKQGASDKTVRMADKMNALLNSPIFAEMVRKAVEEMCLEGRLVYDLDRDEFLESEDLAREIARRAVLEPVPDGTPKKAASRKKRVSKVSTDEITKGRNDNDKGDDSPNDRLSNH
jgi:hypothetical protein